MRNRETVIQIELCRYVSLKYPKELYTSDLGGVRLSKKQAIQASKMRKRRGHPDWTLYKKTEVGCGLMLEIKKEGTVIYNKNGSMRADPHLREQAEYMRLLRKQGWICCFAVGLDEAMKTVDNYLSGVLS